jgi:hypothetical protein
MARRALFATAHRPHFFSARRPSRRASPRGTAISVPTWEDDQIAPPSELQLQDMAGSKTLTRALSWFERLLRSAR